VLAQNLPEGQGNPYKSYSGWPICNQDLDSLLPEYTKNNGLAVIHWNLYVYAGDTSFES